VLADPAQVMLMLFRLRLRRIVSVGALAVLAAAAFTAVGRGDLASRYAAGQQRAGQLRSQIQTDTHKIRGYEGTIGALRARLALIESSVVIQERLLRQVSGELSAARARLAYLRAQYKRGRRILAAQLVADYESPAPNLVDVVLESSGFQDLLNRVNNMQSIARRNADIIRWVKSQRVAVAAEARRLAVAYARRRRAYAAVLVERDQVAQLKLAIVKRELATAHDRAQKTSQLSALQKTLARQSATLEQQAAAAQAGAFAYGAPPPGGCVNTPFVAHGGEFGFFPAPGTNYSVGEEPIIAARLDALGQALHLHLIGISGYRTPQHSVEVGGFADDPHTRGEASDTPGVEGVPETTLAEFCLTRPFPGPREADHIQEL
jgi:peptidoglycan hydrolase CwlO-like protein